MEGLHKAQGRQPRCHTWDVGVQSAGQGAQLLLLGEAPWFPVLLCPSWLLHHLGAARLGSGARAVTGPGLHPSKPPPTLVATEQTLTWMGRTCLATTVL